MMVVLRCQCQGCDPVARAEGRALRVGSELHPAHEELSVRFPADVDEADTGEVAAEQRLSAPTRGRIEYFECLIEHHPLRSLQNDAGDGEQLLHIVVQSLVPSLRRVEQRLQPFQTHCGQRPDSSRIIELVRCAGITERRAQRSGRYVGALRQEHHRLTRRARDATTAPGPEPDHCTEQQRSLLPTFSADELVLTPRLSMVTSAPRKLATRSNVARQSAMLGKLSTNHRSEVCTWLKAPTTSISSPKLMPPVR